MSNEILDIDELIRIYRGLLVLHDRASCADVAAELAKRGYKTHTGNPPTRQAVHYRLQRDPRGRALLNQTLERVGKEPRYTDVAE